MSRPRRPLDFPRQSFALARQSFALPRQGGGSGVLTNWIFKKSSISHPEPADESGFGPQRLGLSLLD
jgi:hypothetical protein